MPFDVEGGGKPCPLFTRQKNLDGWSVGSPELEGIECFQVVSEDGGVRLSVAEVMNPLVIEPQFVTGEWIGVRMSKGLTHVTQW